MCATPSQRPRCRGMRQQHGAAEQGQDEQTLNHSSFYHHCFLLLCHRVSSLLFAADQGLPPFPGAARQAALWRSGCWRDALGGVAAGAEQALGLPAIVAAAAAVAAAAVVEDGVDAGVLDG